jgi:hypothetical protein
MKNILFGVCMVVSMCARSQGCIAIRNLTGFGQFSLPQYDQEPVKWLFNANTRYSEFHKTYDGSSEKTVPPEDQPFSSTFIMDLSVTRILNNGWSISVDVPIMAGSRKTWQEHIGPSNKTKYTVHSYGLSDIRMTAYKWLFDISTPHRGNIQLGLGVKLPTGDYRYQDYFHKSTTKLKLAPVNNTIQLGDGGMGITIEVNSFLTVAKNLTLYANLFYLFSPRDHNGTSNTSGNDSTKVPFHPTIPSHYIYEAKGDVNSVPDAFTARAGATYTIRSFSLWGGFRWEGSPVHDAIGQNNGQRRAGYAISVEPGINYNFKRTTIFAFVPIPIYRTTLQTVVDKRISKASGEYVSSPGGVADYLLFIGVMFRI